MVDFLRDFIHILRSSDIRISTAESIDAMRVVSLIGLNDKSLLQDSLSQTLAKNLILNVITLFSFLIFIFFISHIFFGERSLSKVFELNKDISIAKKEYNLLLDKKNKITSEINLLRDNNLDADIVSEISHRLLGLIYSDQIVIDIPK